MTLSQKPKAIDIVAQSYAAFDAGDPERRACERRERHEHNGVMNV
jgi:hypothetical protein